MTPSKIEKKYYGLYSWRLPKWKIDIFEEHILIFVKVCFIERNFVFWVWIWILEFGIEHGYVYKSNYTFWYRVWNPSGIFGHSWVLNIDIELLYDLIVHVWFPVLQFVVIWIFASYVWNSLKSHCISFLTGKLFCLRGEGPTFFKLIAVRRRFGEPRYFLTNDMDLWTPNTYSIDFAWSWHFWTCSFNRDYLKQYTKFGWMIDFSFRYMGIFCIWNLIMPVGHVWTLG